MSTGTRSGAPRHRRLHNPLTAGAAVPRSPPARERRGHANRRSRLALLAPQPLPPPPPPPPTPVVVFPARHCHRMDPPTHFTHARVTPPPRTGAPAYDVAKPASARSRVKKIKCIDLTHVSRRMTSDAPPWDIRKSDFPGRWGPGKTVP